MRRPDFVTVVAGQPLGVHLAATTGSTGSRKARLRRSMLTILTITVIEHENIVAACQNLEGPSYGRVRGRWRLISKHCLREQWAQTTVCYHANGRSWCPLADCLAKLSEEWCCFPCYLISCAERVPSRSHGSSPIQLVPLRRAIRADLRCRWKRSNIPFD